MPLRQISVNARKIAKGDFGVGALRNVQAVLIAQLVLYAIGHHDTGGILALVAVAVKIVDILFYLGLVKDLTSVGREGQVLQMGVMYAVPPV